MSYSSGRKGHCERCGCARNDHQYKTCAGGDYNKRKKKWVPCTIEWSRCSTGAHDHLFDDDDALNVVRQYVDCVRCWKHPGAPPEGFHWTQSDDERYALTADELGIPYPTPTTDGGTSSKRKDHDKQRRRAEMVDEDGSPQTFEYDELDPEPDRKGKGVDKSDKHQRHGKVESSEDELAWDEERLEEKHMEFQMQQLALQSTSKSEGSPTQYLQEGGPATGMEHQYVEARYNGKNKITFQDPITDKTVTTSRDRWEASTISYNGGEQRCWLFKSKSLGCSFFSWTIEEELPKGRAAGRRDHQKQKPPGHQESAPVLPSQSLNKAKGKRPSKQQEDHSGGWQPSEEGASEHEIATTYGHNVDPHLQVSEDAAMYNDYDALEQHQQAPDHPQAPSGHHSRSGGVSKRREHIEVQVAKQSHKFSSDEYLFKDQRGHTRSTKKEDWREEGHGSQKVWVYRGKQTTYISLEKIG